MNIRAKSEKGFSLIELLVVVAIIGVLAAVGVVGYQGYIDSTKQSVTESNSKAIHQWILNTKTVRAAGIEVDPSTCDGSDLAACFEGASGVASSFDNAPFQGFKNPYSTSDTGTDAIVGFSASTAPATDNTVACTTHHASATKGDIMIWYENGTVQSGGTDINVFYCSIDGKIKKQTGLTDITWN